MKNNSASGAPLPCSSVVKAPGVLWSHMVCFVSVGRCVAGGAHHGPLDHDVQLSVIRQVTEGVSYLHSKKNAHRDIKPNNILVRPVQHKDKRLVEPTPETLAQHGRSFHATYGCLAFAVVWALRSAPRFEVKLTDLEYTKEIEDHSRSSGGTRVATSCVGTQGWQAPEVQAGVSNKEPSDIFSVGLVFFFVLSGGEHALGNTNQERSTRMDSLKQRKSTAPIRDRLRVLCKRAGPAAADVVNAMLQPEKERRPTALQVHHLALGHWDDDARSITCFFRRSLLMT